MKRRNCHMQSVGNKFPVKDSARDITFGEDGRLFSQFHLLETLYQLQVSRAMWFRQALQLAGHQRRNHRAIFRQFMLPPADGKVAPKGLAIIQVGADYRSFQIGAWLHWCFYCLLEVSGDGLFFCSGLASSDSNRTMPFSK